MIRAEEELLWDLDLGLGLACHLMVMVGAEWRLGARDIDR